MRRFFLASLAFIAFTLPAFAQAKHPFTFEDMMKLKRVGEPEVFAGRQVGDLQRGRCGSRSQHEDAAHLDRAARLEVQEREIIADQDADRPRWAPDGKRFAFLSTKEGGSQVWIADFDGAAGTVTAVHKLTAIATEAGGELWSPDGKNILFTSDVYPECDGRPAEESDCNREEAEGARRIRRSRH